MTSSVYTLYLLGGGLGRDGTLQLGTVIAMKRRTQGGYGEYGNTGPVCMCVLMTETGS